MGTCRRQCIKIDNWTQITFGKDRYHLVKDMSRWCDDNIGKGGWVRTDEMIWLVESAYGTTTFFFKESKSAILFSLRWA